MFKKLFFFSLVAIVLFTGSSFSNRKGAKAGINLVLNHVIGNRPLRFDTVTYYNALKQDFVVTKLKYYLGRFELTGKNGNNFKSKDYFLVDSERPGSEQVKLFGIDEGEYTGISFILGVDSVDNCGGAQTGVLDPIHGMFWTWNTGYIFLKFEGRSSVAPTPGHLFEYHIGGFKQPVNCIRKFEIKFPRPLFCPGGKFQRLDLAADLLELLQNPNTVDFKKLPAVSDSRNATVIADNYSDFISLK